MKARLLNLWDRFRTGFWFVPLLFVVAAVIVAVAMPMVDAASEDWLLDRVPWIATTTAAARPTLSVIGGAMITVTGVVFSITVVALSIASSQFGTRTLRNFTDDRVTQVAIGMFVGTSLYCFLVMRSVRELNGSAFVPHLSVAVGVLLAMISIGVLILFIHHVAMAIQAPQILDSLGYDLDGAIDRLFPEKIGEPPKRPDASDGECQAGELPEEFATVKADRQGYIQGVDGQGLIELAEAHDLVIELDKRPGDFVASDSRVARVWPADKLTDEIAGELNDAIIVGSRRTPRQDIGCSVDEMVEVAVRALSPGINDPFTAINCIDRLSASLGRLAGREVPSAYRCDGEGHLRLVARPATFVEVLDAALADIRRYGRTSTSVSVRLMGALRLILQYVKRHDYREAILRQADRIIEAFEMENHQPCDRQLMRHSYEALTEAIANGHDDQPAPEGTAGTADVASSTQRTSS